MIESGAAARWSLHLRAGVKRCVGSRPAWADGVTLCLKEKVGGVRSTFPEAAPGRAPATKLDYLGVWSARTGRDRSWAWDGDVELSCSALKYLCFLEEGVPIDGGMGLC